MSNEEMKTCPFCGGDPEFKRVGSNGMTVRCKKCLMGLHQRVRNKSLEWLYFELKSSWNERVSQVVPEKETKT